MFQQNLLTQMDADFDVVSISQNILAETDGKVYCVVPVGMGNSYYCRRASKASKIECFLMDGDGWGQYGPETSMEPQMKEFISGYVCVVDLDP